MTKEDQLTPHGCCSSLTELYTLLLTSHKIKHTISPLLSEVGKETELLISSLPSLHYHHITPPTASPLPCFYYTTTTSTTVLWKPSRKLNGLGLDFTKKVTVYDYSKGGEHSAVNSCEIIWPGPDKAELHTLMSETDWPFWHWSVHAHKDSSLICAYISVYQMHNKQRMTSHMWLSELCERCSISLFTTSEMRLPHNSSELCLNAHEKTYKNDRFIPDNRAHHTKPCYTLVKKDLLYSGRQSLN